MIPATANNALSQKQLPSDRSEGSWILRSWTGCLVAGDGFCSLFVGLSRNAVTVRMTIAIRRSDSHRLARIGEIRRHGLGDVADRANLHHRRLRLLQHQFFVNRANLGLLFISLLAARAVFFRC